MSRERVMSHTTAYVLLDSFLTPDVNALVDTLRQRHPDIRWDVGPQAAAAKPDGHVIIRCGDHLVVVMSMPTPLPYDEGLWKRASRIWPEAHHAAERHKAHLIVSTIGSAESPPGPKPSTIEQARMVTAAAGGLFAMIPGCCAAVWNDGIARSPRLWLQESSMAFSRYPDHPFALWVDVVPFPSGEGFGATTFGLQPFIDREIEYDVGGLERTDVVRRVAGIAFYLLEHGFRGSIRNGTVIEGDSPADRVKVRARMSRFAIAPALAFGPEHETSDRPKQYQIIPLSIAKNHPLLVMLGKTGLFDASAPLNQIEFWPHHYVSETRLENYDQGINGVLSRILATDAYAAADEAARRALAAGDTGTAKSALAPFAQEVTLFLETARVAFGNRDLHMFMPKQPALRRVH